MTDTTTQTVINTLEAILPAALATSSNPAMGGSLILALNMSNTLMQVAHNMQAANLMTPAELLAAYQANGKALEALSAQIASEPLPPA
jgi:hypothetical protein